MKPRGRRILRACAPITLVLGCFSFSALACPVQTGTGSKTEIGAATVFSGVALANAQQFSGLGLDMLMNMALSCQKNENATIVKLTIFQDADFSSIEAAREWIDPEKPTDVTFSEWLAQYQEVRPKPLAQVIVIGRGQNKIIVSRILRKGRPVEQMVEDSSHVLNSTDELLDLTVNGKVDPEGVLYIRRGNTLRVEDAEKLAKNLVKLIGTDRIMIRIRNDSWFIEDDSFPIAYPFDAKPQVHQGWGLEKPTAPEASSLGGSITCQGLNRCSVEPRQ